jgi:antitoxin MazE
MQATVQKWGNSLALRIPKAFAQEIGLEQDAAVMLAVENGRLVIAPVKDPVYDLDDLVSQITDENQHDEFDWGPPVGNEVW